MVPMRRLVAVGVLFVSFLASFTGVGALYGAFGIREALGIRGALAAGDPVLTVQAVTRPSTSVPVGAQSVTMLTVRLEASCARDITLWSLRLHHRGLGNAADIARVYARTGVQRRTRTVVFSAGDETTATLRFRQMKIRACTTESIDILADFSGAAAAGGEHALTLEAKGDVDADAPVRILVNPAGAITVTTPVGVPAGTVTAELLNVPTPLTYGAARTVARVRLRADTTRDGHAVTAITFVNDGTARGDDLQNFILESSGHTRLSATVPSLDADRVRVVLDPPLILRRNEVRLVQLLADIRASRRRTVRFLIQEPGDVEASPVR